MTLPDPNKEIDTTTVKNDPGDKPLLDQRKVLQTKPERDTRWDDAEDGDDL